MKNVLIISLALIFNAFAIDIDTFPSSELPEIDPSFRLIYDFSAVPNYPTKGPNPSFSAPQCPAMQKNQCDAFCQGCFRKEDIHSCSVSNPSWALTFDDG